MSINVEAAMNLSLEKVKDFIEDMREEPPFGWRLWQAGAFLYDDKLEFYQAFHGQGLNEIVYNGKYEDIVYLHDLANTYEWTLEEAVSIAYERVQSMIEINIED